MAQRIGVFGGTFDPPHLGHLVAAVNVRHALQLDAVWLVVANEPWQKVELREITPAEIRFELVQAAVEGVDGLVASRLEIDRGGTSYTADTLSELARTHSDTEWFLVLGFDAAASILTWERVDEVTRLATLVVVDRPGASEAAERLPEEFRWERIEVPRLEVSSTDLRARAGDGRPLTYLLPPAVISLIRSRGLYAASSIE